MTEKYIMRENSIPDGMLHDQSLYKISFENGILTLSFDVFLSEEEYKNNNFAKKYLAYKRCHIRCTIENEEYCEVHLETNFNKKSKGKMTCLALSEFIDIANKEIRKRAEKGFHPWTYLYTFASPNINIAKIELCICDMYYKNTDYSMCTLELETKQIEYIWE